MSDDLVKQLRDVRQDDCGNDILCASAAERIEKLEAVMGDLAREFELLRFQQSAAHERSNFFHRMSNVWRK